MRRPAIVCLLLSASIGCGGKPSSVTGRVTLDGAPLPRGTVTFHPTEHGGLAYGTIDPDGAYELKTGGQQGLTPGEYDVTVVATEPTPANLPAGATPPIGKRITPERYARPETTDLRAKVEPGANEIDLPLRSKPAS
jgi:hypothetical protein